ncbi:flippase [Thermococcus sp. LS1]|uniref:flippase n=1 Tax=Thermococcus sp. LS1 TaxID=1638259 RepID=UPI00143964A3|nr:flippase [Thermococcus sp. LS1]NJD98748.1 flippase [Thermococcus sp. LS1]
MDEVNWALQRIARGTGIVFAGTVLSMLLGFLTRALIARSLDRSQYGVFSLTLTILNIGITLALLGFANGLPRELSRYRKNEPQRVPELVSTAFIMVTVTSTILTIIMVLSAPYLSPLFNESLLSSTLRIAALSLPFWALLTILVAISRGFGRVREKFYYQNLLMPLIFLLLTVLALFMGWGLSGIFAAYVLSQAASFLALTLETIKLKILPRRLIFKPKLAKELVLFSFPLMLTGILGYIMNWTDTLMLGYYLNSDVVGLYNAAAPIARLLPIFLNSAGFLYIPIATIFFAQRKLQEMERIYRIMTRWVFLLTFPLFALIFMFPEVTITTFFGSKYAEAALTLQILAAGFMFHTLLGLNGMSLTVIGETNANLIGNFFASVANVVLNVLLIPIYGIEGAATATAVSYIIANIFRTSWLYKKTGIHPFSGSYLKQLLVGIGIIVILKLANVSVSSIWAALGVLLVFFVVYFALILVLRSVEKEDIELLAAVEKKLGINLKWLRKILERFIRV